MANNPDDLSQHVTDLALVCVEQLEHEIELFCDLHNDVMPDVEDEIDFHAWVLFNQKRIFRERKALRDAIDGSGELDSDNEFENQSDFEKRFEFRRRCGQGSFGMVNEYFDRRCTRRVAIKEIKNRPSMAMSEAKAVATVQNEHVVIIHEVVRVGGNPMLVYEYLNGFSLRYRLSEGKKFSEMDVAIIIRQLATGLQAIHDKGLVHADVKPENVMLVGKTCKLVDLGLAFRHGDRPIYVCGTEEYRSPEQDRNSDQFGFRSDIYSLGVVMYEMLTKVLPVPPDKISDVAFQPETVRTIASHVSRDIESICMKCIARRPEDRFRDSQALIEELTRFEKGSVLECRPDTPATERVTKWVKRYKKTSMALGFLAIFLIGLSLAFYKISETEKSERAAVEEKLRAESLARASAEVAARSEKAEKDALAKKNAAEIQSRIDAEKRRDAEIAARREAEKRRTAAEKHLFDVGLLNAKRAAQRGQWKTVLDLLDAASKSPLSDPVEIRFAEIDALDALGKDGERDENVDWILGQQELPEFMRGSLLLLKADVFENRGKCDQADTLIAEAREVGLNPADNEFANSIQAATFDDSICHLEECIRLNRANPDRPYHLRAHAKLAMEYLLMGRKRDARQLCIEMMFASPNDFNYQLLIGAVDVLEDDLNSAKNRIQSATATPKAMAGTIENGYEALHAVAVSGEYPSYRMFWELIRDLSKHVDFAEAGFIEEFSGSWSSFAPFTRGERDTASMSVKMPRRIKYLFAYAVEHVARRNDRSLESILKILPEPSLKAYLSLKKLRKLGKSLTRDTAIEILNDLRSLEDKEFLMPRLRTFALDCSSTISMYLENDFTDENKREVIRSLNKYEPEPRPYGTAMIRGVYESHDGNHELANAYFHRHLMRDPKEQLDGGNIGIWAAYSALEVGDYCRALKMARFVKKLPRRVPPKSLNQIKKEALEGIERVASEYSNPNASSSNEWWFPIDIKGLMDWMKQ